MNTYTSTSTYTSPLQSVALGKFLPLESADMCYKCIEDDPYDIVCKPYSEWKEEYKGLLVRGDANVIPCWSLAALLDVLPKTINHETLFIETSAVLWHIGYRNVYIARADNPVDACVDMIEKLHEQKLL